MGQGGQLNMPVVMMSGHASIDTAVEATRIGAFDFLENPSPCKTAHHGAAGDEIRRYAGQSGAESGSPGQSPVVHELKRALERVVPVKSPILLTGEPGGFELVARFFIRPTPHG